MLDFEAAQEFIELSVSELLVDVCDQCIRNFETCNDIPPKNFWMVWVVMFASCSASIHFVK